MHVTPADEEIRVSRLYEGVNCPTDKGCRAATWPDAVRLNLFVVRRHRQQGREFPLAIRAKHIYVYADAIAHGHKYIALGNNTILPLR